LALPGGIESGKVIHNKRKMFFILTDEIDASMMASSTQYRIATPSDPIDVNSAEYHAKKACVMLAYDITQAEGGSVEVRRKLISDARLDQGDVETTSYYSVDRATGRITILEKGKELIDKLAQKVSSENPDMSFEEAKKIIKNSIEMIEVYSAGVQYEVIGDEIKLYDESSGKLGNRRLSDGKHTILELYLKEVCGSKDVVVRGDSKSKSEIGGGVARTEKYVFITGSSGTAIASQNEIEKILKNTNPIVQFPTHKEKNRTTRQILYNGDAQLIANTRNWLQQRLHPRAGTLATGEAWTKTTFLPAFMYQRSTNDAQKMKGILELIFKNDKRFEGIDMTIQIVDGPIEKTELAQIIEKAGQQNVITIFTDAGARGNDYQSEFANLAAKPDGYIEEQMKDLLKILPDEHRADDISRANLVNEFAEELTDFNEMKQRIKEETNLEKKLLMILGAFDNDITRGPNNTARREELIGSVNGVFDDMFALCTTKEQKEIFLAFETKVRSRYVEGFALLSQVSSRTIADLLQALGRVGRQSDPSDVTILYDLSDMGVDRRFVEQGFANNSKKMGAFLTAVDAYQKAFDQYLVNGSRTDKDLEELNALKKAVYDLVYEALLENDARAQDSRIENNKKDKHVMFTFIDAVEPVKNALSQQTTQTQPLSDFLENFTNAQGENDKRKMRDLRKQLFKLLDQDEYILKQPVKSRLRHLVPSLNIKMYNISFKLKNGNITSLKNSFDSTQTIVGLLISVIQRKQYSQLDKKLKDQITKEEYEKVLAKDFIKEKIKTTQNVVLENVTVRDIAGKTLDDFQEQFLKATEKGEDAEIFKLQMIFLELFGSDPQAMASFSIKTKNGQLNVLSLNAENIELFIGILKGIVEGIPYSTLNPEIQVMITESEYLRIIDEYGTDFLFNSRFKNAYMDIITEVLQYDYFEQTSQLRGSSPLLFKLRLEKWTKDRVNDLNNVVSGRLFTNAKDTVKEYTSEPVTDTDKEKASKSANSSAKDIFLGTLRKTMAKQFGFMQRIGNKIGSFVRKVFRFVARSPRAETVFAKKDIPEFLGKAYTSTNINETQQVYVVRDDSSKVSKDMLGVDENGVPAKVMRELADKIKQGQKKTESKKAVKITGQTIEVDGRKVNMYSTSEDTADEDMQTAKKMAYKQYLDDLYEQGLSATDEQAPDFVFIGKMPIHWLPPEEGDASQMLTDIAKSLIDKAKEDKTTDLKGPLVVFTDGLKDTVNEFEVEFLNLTIMDNVTAMQLFSNLKTTVPILDMSLAENVYGDIRVFNGHVIFVQRLSSGNILVRDFGTRPDEAQREQIRRLYAFCQLKSQGSQKLNKFNTASEIDKRQKRKAQLGAFSFLLGQTGTDDTGLEVALEDQQISQLIKTEDISSDDIKITETDVFINGEILKAIPIEEQQKPITDIDLASQIPGKFKQWFFKKVQNWINQGQIIKQWISNTKIIGDARDSLKGHPTMLKAFDFVFLGIPDFMWTIIPKLTAGIYQLPSLINSKVFLWIDTKTRLWNELYQDRFGSPKSIGDPEKCIDAEHISYLNKRLDEISVPESYKNEFAQIKQRIQGFLRAPMDLTNGLNVIESINSLLDRMPENTKNKELCQYLQKIAVIVYNQNLLNPRVTIALARVYARNNDLDSAIKYANNVLRFTKDLEAKENCYLFKTEILCQQGKYDEAAAAIAKITGNLTLTDKYFDLRTEILDKMNEKIIADKDKPTEKTGIFSKIKGYATSKQRSMTNVLTNKKELPKMIFWSLVGFVVFSYVSPAIVTLFFAGAPAWLGFFAKGIVTGAIVFGLKTVTKLLYDNIVLRIKVWLGIVPETLTYSKIRAKTINAAMVSLGLPEFSAKANAEALSAVLKYGTETQKKVAIETLFTKLYNAKDNDADIITQLIIEIINNNDIKNSDSWNDVHFRIVSFLGVILPTTTVTVFSGVPLKGKPRSTEKASSVLSNKPEQRNFLLAKLALKEGNIEQARTLFEKIPFVLNESYPLLIEKIKLSIELGINLDPIKTFTETINKTDQLYSEMLSIRKMLLEKAISDTKKTIDQGKDAVSLQDKTTKPKKEAEAKAPQSVAKKRLLSLEDDRSYENRREIALLYLMAGQYQTAISVLTPILSTGTQNVPDAAFVIGFAYVLLSKKIPRDVMVYIKDAQVRSFLRMFQDPNEENIAFMCAKAEEMLSDTNRLNLENSVQIIAILKLLNSVISQPNKKISSDLQMRAYNVLLHFSRLDAESINIEILDKNIVKQLWINQTDLDKVSAKQIVGDKNSFVNKLISNINKRKKTLNEKQKRIRQLKTRQGQLEAKRKDVELFDEVEKLKAEQNEDLDELYIEIAKARSFTEFYLLFNEFITLAKQNNYPLNDLAPKDMLDKICNAIDKFSDIDTIFCKKLLETFAQIVQRDDSGKEDQIAMFKYFIGKMRPLLKNTNIDMELKKSILNIVKQYSGIFMSLTEDDEQIKFFDGLKSMGNMWDRILCLTIFSNRLTMTGFMSLDIEQIDLSTDPILKEMIFAQISRFLSGKNKEFVSEFMEDINIKGMPDYKELCERVFKDTAIVKDQDTDWVKEYLSEIETVKETPQQKKEKETSELLDNVDSYVSDISSYMDLVQSYLDNGDHDTAETLIREGLEKSNEMIKFLQDLYLSDEAIDKERIQKIIVLLVDIVTAQTVMLENMLKDQGKLDGNWYLSRVKGDISLALALFGFVSQGSIKKILNDASANLKKVRYMLPYSEEILSCESIIAFIQSRIDFMTSNRQAVLTTEILKLLEKWGAIYNTDKDKLRSKMNAYEDPVAACKKYNDLISKLENEQKQIEELENTRADLEKEKRSLVSRIEKLLEGLSEAQIGQKQGIFAQDILEKQTAFNKKISDIDEKLKKAQDKIQELKLKTADIEAECAIIKAILSLPAIKIVVEKALWVIINNPSDSSAYKDAKLLVSTVMNISPEIIGSVINETIIQIKSYSLRHSQKRRTEISEILKTLVLDVFAGIKNDNWNMNEFYKFVGTDDLFQTNVFGTQIALSDMFDAVYAKQRSSYEKVMFLYNVLTETNNPLLIAKANYLLFNVVLKDVDLGTDRDELVSQVGVKVYQGLPQEFRTQDKIDIIKDLQQKLSLILEKILSSNVNWETASDLEKTLLFFESDNIAKAFVDYSVSNKSADAFTHKARDAISDSNMFEAMSFSQQAIDINEKDVKAYLIKAEALKALGRESEAIFVGEKALAAAPDNFEVMELLWTLYVNTNNLFKASDIALKISEKYKKDKKPELALKYAEEAYQLRPRWFDANKAYIDQLIETGRIEQAMSILTGIESDSNDFLDLKKPRKAKKNFGVIVSSEQAPYIIEKLMEVKLKQNDPEAVLGSYNKYRKFIALTSESIRICAMASNITGDHYKAVDLIKQAQRKDEAISEEGQLRIARIYLDSSIRSRIEDGISICRQIIDNKDSVLHKEAISLMLDLYEKRFELDLVFDMTALIDIPQKLSELTDVDKQKAKLEVFLEKLQDDWALVAPEKLEEEGKERYLKLYPQLLNVSANMCIFLPSDKWQADKISANIFELIKKESKLSNESLTQLNNVLSRLLVMQIESRKDVEAKIRLLSRALLLNDANSQAAYKLAQIYADTSIYPFKSKMSLHQRALQAIKFYELCKGDKELEGYDKKISHELLRLYVAVGELEKAADLAKSLSSNSLQDLEVTIDMQSVVEVTFDNEELAQLDFFFDSIVRFENMVKSINEKLDETTKVMISDTVEQEVEERLIVIGLININAQQQIKSIIAGIVASLETKNLDDDQYAYTVKKLVDMISMKMQKQNTLLVLTELLESLKGKNKKILNVIKGAIAKRYASEGNFEKALNALDGISKLPDNFQMQKLYWLFETALKNNDTNKIKSIFDQMVTLQKSNWAVRYTDNVQIFSQAAKKFLQWNIETQNMNPDVLEEWLVLFSTDMIDAGIYAPLTDVFAIADKNESIELLLFLNDQAKRNELMSEQIRRVLLSDAVTEIKGESDAKQKRAEQFEAAKKIVVSNNRFVELMKCLKNCVEQEEYNDILQELMRTYYKIEDFIKTSSTKTLLKQFGSYRKMQQNREAMLTQLYNAHEMMLKQSAVISKDSALKALDVLKDLQKKMEILSMNEKLLDEIAFKNTFIEQYVNLQQADINIEQMYEYLLNKAIDSAKPQIAQNILKEKNVLGFSDDLVNRYITILSQPNEVSLDVLDYMLMIQLEDMFVRLPYQKNMVQRKKLTELINKTFEQLSSKARVQVNDAYSLYVFANDIETKDIGENTKLAIMQNFVFKKISELENMPKDLVREILEGIGFVRFQDLCRKGFIDQTLVKDFFSKELQITIPEMLKQDKDLSVEKAVEVHLSRTNEFDQQTAEMFLDQLFVRGDYGSLNMVIETFMQKNTAAEKRIYFMEKLFEKVKRLPKESIVSFNIDDNILNVVLQENITSLDFYSKEQLKLLGEIFTIINNIGTTKSDIVKRSITALNKENELS
ncbi:MAG: hypothetical protein PHQ52_03870, partial [Candidatus Omnitrophica bacterium]|nr:hypothetical protein [Candidatus Omnitrophota bacterium]